MAFERFVSSVFTSGGGGITSMLRGMRGMRGTPENIRPFLNVLSTLYTSAGYYDVFPQFYTFRYRFSSDEFPVFGSSM